MTNDEELLKRYLEDNYQEYLLDFGKHECDCDIESLTKTRDLNCEEIEAVKLIYPNTEVISEETLIEI